MGATIHHAPRAPMLRGLRILVAEDEPLCAYEMCHGLVEAGAVIVGPAHTIAEAIELAATTVELDGAVLDINLHGEVVFEVAAALARRGVPFVFATGYGRDVRPGPFTTIPHFQKPVEPSEIVQVLNHAISAFFSPSQNRRREMGLES
jgi:CheY-like chemotaxis protein